MIRIGLRVDVDTLRGTRIGVANLVRVLAAHNIRASFFFSVGPDNMGRHLRRLIRPAFLFKMLRTGAPRLYGWDILLRGTLVAGPLIGERCREIIRATAAAGHETGLHAWDHHLWQTRIERLDRPGISAEIRKGYEALADILDRPPDCFAAPGWRITPDALYALEQFPFRFESDCRGHSLFRPVEDGRLMRHVQVPTTLPTYDELIGAKCTPETYNDYLLETIRPEGLNVLTIHAEAEGIVARPLFEQFLDLASRRGMRFCPLGDLLSETEMMNEYDIFPTQVPGREGWVSGQGRKPVEEWSA
jgi:undecaprenyl phosphate-alpha-L-ara4FN deformylase